MRQAKNKEFSSLMNILPPEEVKSIIHQGVMLRLPLFEGRLTLAREKIEQFQKKYQTTYKNLKSKGLPNNADYQFHEDFIEWEHWERIYKQAASIIRVLKETVDKDNSNESSRYYFSSP